MVTEAITLKSIKTAQQRINPLIRTTPVIWGQALKESIPNAKNLALKLECQQVAGSFKVRGALNKVLNLPRDQRQSPLFAASGGNHGLAVAYAAYTQKMAAKIYLPQSTDPRKVQKIQKWGADVVLAGRDIKEAIENAHQDANLEKATYIHPFSDADVICGQGTLGLDIFEQLGVFDVVVLAIGGGGLMGGVGTALKALCSQLRLVGVEPESYPTLTQSLKEKEPVLLERCPTVAVTLAVRQTTPLNLMLAQQLLDQTVLVSETEIKKAAAWLWQEYAIAAEYSGAAALAAILCGKVKISDNEKVCVIICGAGRDGLIHSGSN